MSSIIKDTNNGSDDKVNKGFMFYKCTSTSHRLITLPNS